MTHKLRCQYPRVAALCAAASGICVGWMSVTSAAYAAAGNGGMAIVAILAVAVNALSIAVNVYILGPAE